MKTKLLLALLSTAFLLSFSNKASAGIHLEPFLGYGMGKFENSGETDNHKGLLYGARLGYSLRMFALGAEYQGTNTKDDSTDAVTTKLTDLGAFVAFEFPVMVRAYASYFFNTTGTRSDSTGSMDIEGTGMKIGVGFKGFPLVSINLEYITHKFTKAKFSGISQTIDVSDKTTALTVSFPFNL